MTKVEKNGLNVIPKMGLQLSSHWLFSYLLMFLLYVLYYVNISFETPFLFNACRIISIGTLSYAFSKSAEKNNLDN
jgi:hypothetical protein